MIIFAASSACRSTSSNLWTQRIEYRDRLSFSWNFSPNNGSMQIKNLGPGSVTVELELRDGRTTKQDLDEGASNYYMLQNLTRVELLHNTATTAAAEWSILEDLRNGVSVRAQ